MAIEIPGYQINEQLDQSTRSVIHLATREDDGLTLAIKTLRNKYPSRQEIARFQHEYQIHRKTEVDGVAKVYGMEEYGGRQAMLLEYIGGGDLSSLMAQDLALPLDFFFTIAIQLAQTIGEIHQNYIIHKDIKPKNILWDPQAEQVKIIDFGIATELSREHQSQDSDILKGSIAYISPEQTGRMNRSIDYRTDFYSLGVTFYELLTGQLPFDDKQDTMGMIHCHIARDPEPVHQINPDIPSAVSALVAKLMAKNAEDRYKSAFGLKNDLEACRTQWQQDGAIIDFVPGQLDISDRFEIPQKLYGRETEIAHLLEAFQEVTEGDSKILLVGGYSGIGKSALINEVHKSIVSHHGYFIEGKFDQFQRNIPYSAIAQAFRGLMQQLLSEPSERLEQWKTALLDTLGPNAQVLIDIIPELESVIGSHPEVPHLGTDENQNRFNQVFLHFLQLFTHKEHPLVLFIDDLQWVDSATLNLIKLFTMDGQQGYFLFLGAYRDNEVDPHHPFIQVIDEIRQADIKVPQLTLTPLELQHVNQLIAETLATTPEQTLPLAELVYKKTAGNPFFVNQFLKNIYENKNLKFDIKDKLWRWDLDTIQSESSSSNVVELMVAKIARLPDSTRDLLRLGSCIGNRFNLKTLAVISKRPLDEVARDLWLAVKAGLLLPEDESHSLLKEIDSNSNQELDSFPVAIDRFLHDRVQQAAYSLIEENQRRQVHLEIGRLLLQEVNEEEEELEASCFDIVEHYNKGIELVDNSTERQRIAELNLMAGQRAKEATAYQPALQYFSIGSNWLAENSVTNSRLRFELGKGQIACHFLLSKVEDGIREADKLLKQFPEREDRVEINNILILYYGGAGEMDRAIDIALDSLRFYDIDLTRNPSQAQLLMELARAKLRLRNKSQAELLAMPKFQDKEVEEIFSLLKELVAPTYLQGLNNLLPYILLRMFNLTLIHGNGPVASFAYSGYALLWAKLDDFTEAHRFGVIAMEYNKQVDNPPMEARCYFMSTSFALYWKQPLIDSQEPRRIGLQKLIDTGEYFWASYIYLFGFWQEVALSKSIDNILDFTTRESVFAKRAGQVEPYHVHTLHHNLFKNLAGKTADRNSLDVQEGDEAKAIAYFKQNVTSTMGRFYHAVNRLVLNFFYEDYEQAASIALQSELTEEVIRDGTFTRVIYSFYSCLALLNNPAKPQAQKGKKSRKLYLNLKKKIKRWYSICPENFSCIWHLLLAEEARVEHRDAPAIEHYNQALRGAQGMDSLWLEGLSNELYARYWLAQENHKVGAVYLGEARYFYYRWGAMGKVRHMEERYPQLLDQRQAATANLLDTFHGEETFTGTTTSGSSTSKESVLDIETLAKASQTLAGELQIDKLQQKLMQFLMENAGAQRGFLILMDQGKLMIEAQSSVEQQGELERQSIPLEQASNLATAVVLFVARSKELVVLSDAATEGAFSNDPYITKSQTKSLLCLPLIDKSKLVGILYLENNLATGAFTPNRVSILKVLSAEIAIALENARLYHNLEENNRTLEQRVEERTQELHGINDQLLHKNREIQESKQLIEAKNAAITSSIVYAQRIQQALMPTNEKIAESLEQFFVLYRPKQIVSGDFYWFSKLDKQIFIAVVDCTGHGVPGALLSMIGSTLLNKIINENRIVSPAKILEHLHIEVRLALKQQGQKRQQNDGMDIVLCRIEPAKQELVFAGAKRPLYLAKKENNSRQDSARELLEIRGDRKSIGGRQKEAQRTFTDHAVNYDSGDMIYLLSDGFTDQQDENNQKFGSTQFEAFLNEITHHDVPTQHAQLVSELERHQGDENQRDDITLVGVRLN